MSYSSPSGSRKLPAARPATASRTVRSASTAWHAEQRGLLGVDVEVEVGALQAHRVHDVARAGDRRAISFSTSPASRRSVSMSGPITRISIGAATGGPFSNWCTLMRAPG